MIKIINESFNLANKHIILATPLILFSLLSTLYILFSMGGNDIGKLIALFLFFLMLGAFISGWFFMVVKCIKEPDIDPNELITEFPAGVGDYFIQSLGFIVISSIVSIIFIAIACIIGIKTIGNVGFSLSAMSDAMTSAATLKAFLMTLSKEQLIKLNCWNVLLFFTMSLTYFVLMFYPPAMFFKNKNPFMAIYIEVKDLFCRKIITNILLFVIIYAIYMLISIITVIAGNNVIVHFIITLANFYFLVFAVICIFKYYYMNFVQIGGNIDTKV